MKYLLPFLLGALTLPAFAAAETGKECNARVGTEEQAALKECDKQPERMSILRPREACKSGATTKFAVEKKKCDWLDLPAKERCINLEGLSYDEKMKTCMFAGKIDPKCQAHVKKEVDARKLECDPEAKAAADRIKACQAKAESDHEAAVQAAMKQFESAKAACK